MPAVLDAPAVLDYEAHDLTAAQPRVRPDRVGLWRTVVQSLMRPRVHRCHRPPSSPRSVHTYVAPADLLARQYPTLFIQAYAGI
jgi:hypothetical protein